jgi:hypothetical protein
MTFWIRAVDGKTVTDVWDTTPPAGQDGWREAVEVKPALIPHKQHHGAHYFDLTKTPAQIIWPIVDYTPEEQATIQTQLLKQANKVVQDQLDAIDVKKVRAITDALLSGNMRWIRELEKQAVALRAQIKTKA